MLLVLMTATRNDNGQLVTGVVRGVTETAPHDHGGVVQQRPLTLGNGIEVDKELIEMFEDVDFNASEIFQHFGATAVMGKRVPSSRGSWYINGTVDPIH